MDLNGRGGIGAERVSREVDAQCAWLKYSHNPAALKPDTAATLVHKEFPYLRRMIPVQPLLANLTR